MALLGQASPPKTGRCSSAIDPFFLFDFAPEPRRFNEGLGPSSDGGGSEHGMSGSSRTVCGRSTPSPPVEGMESFCQWIA